MTEVYGPDFITLLVADLDASVRFYKEKIGLKASPEKQPHAQAFDYKALRPGDTTVIREGRHPRPGRHHLAPHLRCSGSVQGLERAGRAHRQGPSGEPVRHDIFVPGPRRPRPVGPRWRLRGASREEDEEDHGQTAQEPTDKPEGRHGSTLRGYRTGLRSAPPRDLRRARVWFEGAQVRWQDLRDVEFEGPVRRQASRPPGG